MAGGIPQTPLHELEIGQRAKDVRRLDRRLDSVFRRLNTCGDQEVASRRVLPAPVPTVGISQRLVDDGAEGVALLSQVPERLVGERLRPRQVVLHAGDGAAYR